MTGKEMEAAWHELAGRAGLVEGNVEAIFQDLCRRYSEPGRAYHTLDHVAAMLDTVSEFEDTLHDDVAVRLAVWFHDAVYDTRRSDDEEQSAAHAAELLSRAGVSPLLLPAVERLILATKTHQAPPDDTDCRLMLDADLAVLGVSAAEYDRYAQAICEEYAWVPEDEYRAGRRRVLEGFLERERLYHTASLFNPREQMWRTNLRREIAWLTNPQKP